LWLWSVYKYPVLKLKKGEKTVKVKISRRKIALMLTLLLLINLLGVGVVATALELDPVVTFPDPNLEAAIRGTLGKAYGDITTEDMAELETLWAASRTYCEQCLLLSKQFSPFLKKN
jgi:hypothetical protein